MSVNTMGFEQASAILQDIYEQATGQATLAVLDEAKFVSVGTTLLQKGTEPVLNAISQVITKTIFSNRPYKGLLNFLRVNEEQFGGIVRKIKYGDIDIVDDNSYKLTDGQAVDPWTYKKPKVIQLNWYGGDVCEVDVPSITREQMYSAFSSSAEFGSFVTGLLTEVNNKIEVKHELYTRMCLQNYAGAKYKDTDNVIHLITEYKADTGVADITSANYMSPEYFSDFTKWLYARLKTLSDMFAERSTRYTQQIDGHTIMTHTPYDRQKLILNSKLMNNIQTTVLSSVYHDEKLKMMQIDKINFWQDPDNPLSVNVKPAYLDSTTGNVVEDTTGVSISNLVGIMFDDEAMGLTVKDAWSGSTPMNPKGGYYNMFFHFTDKVWNDFTEKGVLLMLD